MSIIIVPDFQHQSMYFTLPKAKSIIKYQKKDSKVGVNKNA